MKSYSVVFVFAALALPACEKSNDIPRLQDEASVIAKYYAPKVEELGKRIDAINQRAKGLTSGAVGVQDASKRLYDARDRLASDRTIVMAPNSGKSSVEKQADELAKAGNAADLQKLIDETEEKLETDTMVAANDLTTVESWLTQTEANSAQPAAHPNTPAPESASPNPAVP